MGPIWRVLAVSQRGQQGGKSPLGTEPVLRECSEWHKEENGKPGIWVGIHKSV